MDSNVSELPKAKNNKERKSIQTASKLSSDNNPCLKEHKLSLKCLDDNNYDKDKCITVFKNYKACRDFWTKVVADRRNRRIKPPMPPPEEREQIRIEYMKVFHANT